MLTKMGTVIGTPAYMSPEQASGRIEEVNEASDQYSVGAMLYQILAGAPPYADRGCRRANELLAAVKEGAPTPLETLVARAPGEVVAIPPKPRSDMHSPPDAPGMPEYPLPSQR